MNDGQSGASVENRLPHTQHWTLAFLGCTVLTVVDLLVIGLLVVVLLMEVRLVVVLVVVVL